MPAPLARPVLLVGAFERHNFGDLLLGRVMARCLADQGLQPVYASILPADLRAQGGAWVNSFADLAPFLPPDVPIVHVGGETISCPMAMALRMDVPAVVDNRLANRLVRSCQPSGLDDREFAYLTPPVETIRGKTCRWHNRYFFGVGGASIAGQAQQLAGRLREVFRDARWLAVRDNAALRALHDCGVAHARPSWDAGVLAPCLAGGSAALAAPVAAEPGRYLLFHANKAFLNSLLDLLAAQIAAAAGRFSGVRIALAAAATNHDSVEASGQLAAQLASAGVAAEFCPDVHLDTITALIRDAACVVSTSLHYRIVALTHGVPRVSLANDKVAGWARDWDPGYPFTCPAEDVADNIARAMAVPREEAVQAAGKARGEALASIHDMVAEIRRHTPDLSLSLPAPVDESGAWQAPLGPGWSIQPDQWIAELGRRVRQAQEGADRAQQDLAEAKEKVRAAREELAGVKKSWWWKLGSPLRKLRCLLPRG